MPPPAQPPLIPLRLPTDEQWILHHVLFDRIEMERRAPSNTDPPPVTVFRAFEKLEEGIHLFTPSELRYMRAELQAHLKRTNAPRSDEVPVRRAVDRITSVLNGRRPTSPA